MNCIMNQSTYRVRAPEKATVNDVVDNRPRFYCTKKCREPPTTHTPPPEPYLPSSAAVPRFPPPRSDARKLPARLRDGALARGDQASCPNLGDCRDEDTHTRLALIQFSQQR